MKKLGQTTLTVLVKANWVIRVSKEQLALTRSLYPKLVRRITLLCAAKSTKQNRQTDAQTQTHSLCGPLLSVPSEFKGINGENSSVNQFLYYTQTKVLPFILHWIRRWNSVCSYRFIFCFVELWRIDRGAHTCIIKSSLANFIWNRN